MGFGVVGVLAIGNTLNRQPWWIDWPLMIVGFTIVSLVFWCVRWPDPLARLADVQLPPQAKGSLQIAWTGFVMGALAWLEATRQHFSPSIRLEATIGFAVSAGLTEGLSTLLSSAEKKSTATLRCLLLALCLGVMTGGFVAVFFRLVQWWILLSAALGAALLALISQRRTFLRFR